MQINVVVLGKLEYGRCLRLQENILGLRQNGAVGDSLLLVEHYPVLTVGRRGQYSNILVKNDELKNNGIEIFDVNRGGDVTYHGPGQIVGYPIMDLNQHGRDIKSFVWMIEDIFIRLLQNEYDIEAVREVGKYTGVWVDGNKITAIGIAVKRWVTMHGFAFNVNTNLEHFKWINPCGITDKGVTSLQKLKGRAFDYQELNEQVIEYFSKVFDMEIKRYSLEEYADLFDLQIDRG